MVTDEDADPDPGIRVAGEKLHIKLAGRPAQESEIAWLKAADCAVAVTVKLPVCTPLRATTAGVATNDNAGRNAWSIMSWCAAKTGDRSSWGGALWV
jgi:hypothetical protein